MKSYYVEEDDIFYAELREGERWTAEEREPCIIVDLDEQGNPLSIEIVGASKTSWQQVATVLQEFKIQMDLYWVGQVA